MEIENSSEVLDVSEAPQQQEGGGGGAEVVVEKQAVTKPETPEEPENPPAAATATEQPALNGLHAEEPREAEESPAVESPSPPPPPPDVVAPPEPTESSQDAEPEPPLAESDAGQEPMDTETQEVVKEAVAAEVAAVTQEAEKPSEPEAEPEPMKEPETIKSEAEPETMKEEAETIKAAEPETETLKEPETPKVAETVKAAEPEPEPEPEHETPKAPEPETVAAIETVKAADPEPETLKEPETVKAAETPKAAETEPETPKAAEPEPETPKAAEPEPETPKAAEPEPETPKAAEPEPETPKAAEPEPAKAPETVKEPESAKTPEPETVTATETITATESAKAPESEAVLVDAHPETPKAEAEPQQEEEPASPAAGSLSFALLEREQTRDSLRVSRTLVVLRGLPGSGKSFLARAIADTYKDLCSVVSADDHGVKPEDPDACADGYKALDEAVAARCGAGASAAVLVVVDDTNHTQERLARLGEVAEEQHLVAVFLEPLTDWSRDPARLATKSRRGLEEAQLDAMKVRLEEVTLPLFFGWFLLSSVQDKVRCTSMDFLKTLDTLEAFKKHAADFTGKAEKEVDLEQYFQAKGTLHCTTKFCDYGKASGAKEYAEKPAVQELYGSVFELSLTALFVTPRTVGARVSLTEEQLQLWPADGEKEAESAVPAAASLPPGSRAHVTLGCAEGVEPVQTGLDLLELLALQQDGQQGEPVAEMELGSLVYFGEGRWLLGLREPIGVPACFSSLYGRKEAGAAKKEPEKKKKPKCSIL